MASVFLCLSFLLILSLASASSPSSITLSLSPITSSLTSTNSWDFVADIAKFTLQRAYHLKTPHKRPSSALHGSTETPLYPKSYGGYSVSLAFGTPPQKIPLVFDTGSSLMWVPCTKSYTCDNCTFSHVDPKKITTFKLRRSKTFRIVDCRSRKCGWLYGSDVQARCPGSRPQECPMYLMQYGLGLTSGRPITETLDLPGNIIGNFFLGCSVYSVQQPQGIAGFGRAPTSLPNQLKLRKFSYCLLSHDFDDKPKSSPLTLIGTKSCAAGRAHGVKYTPLLKNPSKSPYNEYYYIHLTKITVGKSKTKVKLQSKFLVPSPTGNGGTIVDSGSTFTFMDAALYGPLIKEMAAQTMHYKRAHEAEVRSGFGLCYDIPDARNVSFPELVFHFKGGAVMELPVANYFSFMTDLSVWCLTIISESSPAGPSVPVGPAIILGNYQQQDFYVEYDLAHHRLGFKKQKCGLKKE